MSNSKLPARLVSAMLLPWAEDLLELTVETVAPGGEVLTVGVPAGID